MWRDDHLLLDMLIHARRAVKFNSGVSWERFGSDEMLQAATQYSLQVIGEAASKISREYRCPSTNSVGQDYRFPPPNGA